MTSTLGPERDFDPAELASLLRWYADMGVDLAIEAEPRNRFADCAVEAPRGGAGAENAGSREPSRLAPRGEPMRASATLTRLPDPAALSQEAATQAAREAAQAATSLEALRAAMEAFEGCALKHNATSLVFGEGDPASRIMLIGDAPGADEDREGLPFVGPAGQLLGRMLKSIGLDRSNVYMAHVVPWRPPGNRPLSPNEIAMCQPFIARHIELVKPQVIVCLGSALLNLKDGILRLRGQLRDYTLASGATIPAMPTLPPTYLLRNPAAKRHVWADLRQIRRLLDQAN